MAACRSSPPLEWKLYAAFGLARAGRVAYVFRRKAASCSQQGGIFDSDGLVAAQQEPNESKDRQEKGWHMLRLFVPNPLQVNLLREDATMANDSLRPAEFKPILKRVVGNIARRNRYARPANAVAPGGVH